MATTGKGGFNADRFRKLVAHFRNSNANERDNAFHLAIAELGKASADVFRDMPDVVAELIGGAGSKDTDNLRRELERQLAQSRADAANSRAEANENIAEAARRKAETAQSQEIIDRLLKRIAELEAVSTRKPPPVEDRRPEPQPSPPSPPPRSSPPSSWYENISQEPEPEAASESEWIEIPKWKVGFWTLLPLCTGTCVLFAAMIHRPPDSNDWIWLAQQWWAWIAFAVACIAAWKGLPRFASFIEDKVIIAHFPDLCLRIRAMVVYPRFMLLCLAIPMTFWAGSVVGWDEIVNNRLSVGPLVIGIVAALTFWWLVSGEDDYEKFGAAGLLCKPCVFVVWCSAVYGLSIAAAILIFKLSILWAILVSVALAVGSFSSLEDRLTAWTLADNRRFAGAVVLAVISVFVFGSLIARENKAAHASSPAPQTAAPGGSVSPELRKDFEEWDKHRGKVHHKTGGTAAQQ